jgi:hypothetical protein
VLPHIAVAQSTSAMNWNDVQLRVFSTDGARSTGSFALPNATVQSLQVDGTRLISDPLNGKVKWRVTH